MSSFSGYKTTAFKETQKFFVLDPATGSPSFVQGSDLVSYILPSLNSVLAETTTDAAVNADYEVGKVVQTTGESAPGDGNPGLFLVVAAGTGGIPMLNGNELLVLEGANTALGISYDNTASGYSATNVQEAIDNFAVNTAGEGSDLVAHTGTSDTVTQALDKRTIFVGSVAELEALPVAVGSKVSTLGYYAAGDGGGNEYEIVAGGTGTDDGGSFIDLDNGLQAKGLFPGRVNVKQFGATGDGVTDDTAALQAAIDYSREVHIPSGATLLISSAISVSNLGQSIAGLQMGYYESRIKCVTASATMFNVTEGEFSCSGIVFEGDGATYGAGATVNAFNFDGTAGADVDAHVFNCEFIFVNTVALMNGRNLDIKNCLFSNSQFGVVTKSSSPPSDFRGLVLQNNRFHSMGLTTVAGSICVSVPGASNFKELTVINNYCDDSAVFFSGFASGMSVSSNTILRGVGGIKVDSTGHGIAATERSTTINGNTISMQAAVSNDRHGIEITNASSRGSVVGNTVSGAGRSGIKLTSALLLSVSGNAVFDASKDNTGVYDGIEVDSGSIRNVISGNVINNNANTRKGISIAGADNIVMPNVLSNFSVSNKYDITDDTTVFNEPWATRNAGIGDADATLIPASNDKVQRQSTTLTADRNIALSLTNAYDGATFRIIRVSGGAFNLNVRNATTGGTLIKALQPNEWVDATYVQSTGQWLLSAFGQTI